MQRLKRFFYIIIYTIAMVVAIASMLSILRNTSSRYLKILDFPRIQLFLVSLLCLVFLLSMFKKWNKHHIISIIALLVGLVINGAYLINYTPLVSKAVPDADTSVNATTLKVLLINVKMKNRDEKPTINIIKETQPDLFVAMEVDQWWVNKLNYLKDNYPYSHTKANDVAYGLTIYSKIPFNNIKVQHLNNENVPSFEMDLTFNDKKVKFYAIHPVPPTHFEDLPDNEGQQEKSLVKLGNKIKNRKLPVIVAGDINDVVWSNVNALTETENLLFDVRKGRGFYNSYNADIFFMRWPLDHVFVTKEFSVKRLERLGYVGSDHYPIYIELTF